MADEPRPRTPDLSVQIENLQSDVDELTDGHDKLAREQASLSARFAEAFPGGDHVGHCRYHQLMIENIEAKKRLTQAVTEKTIGGLIFSAIVGVLYACWLYIKKLANEP